MNDLHYFLYSAKAGLDSGGITERCRSSRRTRQIQRPPLGELLGASRSAWPATVGIHSESAAPTNTPSSAWRLRSWSSCRTRLFGGSSTTSASWWAGCGAASAANPASPRPGPFGATWPSSFLHHLNPSLSMGTVKNTIKKSSEVVHRRLWLVINYKNVFPLLPRHWSG